MLDKIFTVGNRKTIALVLALVAVVFGDKLGIVMTEDMNRTVVELVAVFTGGNVLSKFAFALLQKVSGGKVSLPELEEAEAPVQQQDSISDLDQRLNNTWNYAKQIATDTTKAVNDLHLRCKGIEDHVAKQSNSINQLLTLINTQVLPAVKGGQMPPQAGRVPTPNDLYGGEG